MPVCLSLTRRGFGFGVGSGKPFVPLVTRPCGTATRYQVQSTTLFAQSVLRFCSVVFDVALAVSVSPTST